MINWELFNAILYKMFSFPTDSGHSNTILVVIQIYMYSACSFDFIIDLFSFFSKNASQSSDEKNASQSSDEKLNT